MHFLSIIRAVCLFYFISGVAMAAPKPGVFNPKLFKLANGLQVVVITNPRAPIVSQTVFYKVGGMDDPEEKSGMAHFLEHLMFKGESAVPAGKFTEELKRLGGEYNAATSKDATFYYEYVPKSELEKVINLEAGRMGRLILSPEYVNPERGVVLEERRMRTENNPAEVLEEATNNTFFWHHPYGRPNIGWAHEIKTYTAEDAAKFYKDWYAPNNAILVFAGDITVDEVRPLVEKYYGAIPRKELPKRTRNVTEPPHHGVAQRVVLKSPLVDHPRFKRLYPAPNLLVGGEKAYAIEILSFILGGGATSYLYKVLVHEKKVASWVGVSYDPITRGPSIFRISAQPTPGTSIDVLETEIDGALSAFLLKGFTKQELEDAQNRMIAGLDYERDPAFGGAFEIGYALAVGLPVKTVESWPESIKAVTLKEVQMVAQEVLKNPENVTSILLPQPKEEK